MKLSLRPLPHKPSAPTDGLDHVVCCADSNTALCGTDATHHAWKDEFDTPCVVCADLDDEDTCPLFGRCTLGGET